MHEGRLEFGVLAPEQACLARKIQPAAQRAGTIQSALHAGTHGVPYLPQVGIHVRFPQADIVGQCHSLPRNKRPDRGKIPLRVHFPALRQRLPVNTYAPAADAGGSEQVLRRAVVLQRVQLHGVGMRQILFRCVETDIRAVTQHLAENAVCSVTCSRHCQRAEQFDAEPPCPIRFDCVFRHPLWPYCMGAGRPPPDAVQFPQRFHDRLTPRFRTEIASEQGYYSTFCMRLQAMGAKQY